jgi:hypothetical protein
MTLGTLIFVLAIIASSVIFRMALFFYMKKRYNETWRQLGELRIVWPESLEARLLRDWLGLTDVSRNLVRIGSVLVRTVLPILSFCLLFGAAVFVATRGPSPPRPPAVSHAATAVSKTASSEVLGWIELFLFLAFANTGVFIRSYMKRRHGGVWKIFENVTGGSSLVWFFLLQRYRRLGDELLNRLCVVASVLVVVLSSMAVGRFIIARAWGV